jgi:hypothetical protein
MHPALVVALVFCAVVEIWIVFSLIYAALQRYDGRGYERRARDAGRGKLALGR